MVKKGGMSMVKEDIVASIYAERLFQQQPLTDWPAENDMSERKLLNEQM